MRQTLLALVRNSLFGHPVTIPAGLDWSALLKNARQQTVVGLVADAIYRLPPEQQPSAETIAKLQRFMYMNIHSHAVLNANLAGITSLFDRNGLRFVLLKGQSVAKLYPTPELRQCGDIDIYVGPDTFVEARELVRREWEKGDVESYYSSKHFHFNHGEIAIDLHHTAAISPTPWRNKKMQAWLRRHLEGDMCVRTTVGSAEVLVPDPTCNAFFLFYHFWYHYINSGVGLRQICDWTMHLHKYAGEIDLDDLHQIITDMGLMRAWQAFGCISVGYLGLPAEEMPFYNPKAAKYTQSLLDRVFSEGNFGKFNEGKLRTKHPVTNSFKLVKRMSQFLYLAPVEASLTLVTRVGKGIIKMVSKKDINAYKENH